jgi:hypothetical protein
MFKSTVVTALFATSLMACSTMGQLTVKDYTAKNGQHIVGGQVAPKAEFNCKKVAEEKKDWGVSGNMDKVGTYNRTIASAVDTAPKKKANYVNVIPPASYGVGSVNVNGFSGAEVEYYNCKNLPAPAAGK